MEGNLLLEQYSRFKKQELRESPFRFLLNTNIEINPHQINAFCAAVNSLKTGGIILADEVGLGKTIEAGLVLKYVLNTGAKRVLIVLPAALRKQWEIELEEKFQIKSTILDRLTISKDNYYWKTWIENKNNAEVIITSYDYSSKLMMRYPKVIWDFMIIDEAHNLRNVFHGAKRAKSLYDISKNIPKILLTATPLQNSLNDLHGLVSYIDPRIFGSEKSFNRKYIEGENYDDLKQELRPVLYRTLRRDVAKYMKFKKRECLTVDFNLSKEETMLYNMVNLFLKREPLYSIPVNNKGLIILVIRKLLASSSFALIETFEVLKKRLVKLNEGTKSAQAMEGFDLFWDYVEDEMDESGFEEIVDEENMIHKQQIQEELYLVESIIQTANSIEENAKIKALKTALSLAFEYQASNGIEQKAVIFTESKRTQKYIADELRNEGYSEDDILLFNGDFNDILTKEIFRVWQVKNFGKINYGRSVEYKHAIVDYFKSHSRILIATDTGSEGLNLQFCNTVINYDLPWNPQKIEQRIGRCHRYGQTHDVIAINLLNTGNEADKRVYEILSKKFELFEGVFGASDIALGTLESGTSFEKIILDIYQRCNSKNEFKQAFDKLDKQLNSKLNKQFDQLRSVLLTESPESKASALDETYIQIKKYLAEVDFWNKIEEPEMDNKLYYWQINNWGEKYLGSHGWIFLGAFMNNTTMIFPILLLCDENGDYIDFNEDELVGALENANDNDIHYFTPSKSENILFENIYDKLVNEMRIKFNKKVEPIKMTNKLRIQNWVDIQKEQLNNQVLDLKREIEELLIEETWAKDKLQKADILKIVSEKKKLLDKLRMNYNGTIKQIEVEAKKEIKKFDCKYEIDKSFLLVNIVLKF